ncbi:uncharacterized protein BXZ73DRAFT_82977 [Epithele typhae]|uniref:uncharacterized protein n=1 Tax=Epithele typhae TaxID=378194 RepID=UPI0020085DD2|nr:uncharacterized protein BXZ73DRAFT_82977 [Epithele typhae]KAH9911129.1 hypothetical protein BXZ73DRAFT_82977 [Epithele typhae]
MAEANTFTHIQSLQQGEREAGDFFQEWEATLGLAGLDADDPIPMQLVRIATNARYKEPLRALGPGHAPATYLEWRARVTSMDTMWRQDREMERRGRRAQQPFRVRPQWQQQAPARNAAPTQQVALAPAVRRDATGTTFGGGGQLMDIDRARTNNVCRVCVRPRMSPAPNCTNRWHPAVFHRGGQRTVGGPAQALRQQEADQGGVEQAQAQDAALAPPA